MAKLGDQMVSKIIQWYIKLPWWIRYFITPVIAVPPIAFMSGYAFLSGVYWWNFQLNFASYFTVTDIMWSTNSVFSIIIIILLILAPLVRFLVPKSNLSMLATRVIKYRYIFATVWVIVFFP